MTQEEFRKRFKIAAVFCHNFTHKHVNEELPKSLRFLFSEKTPLLKAEEVIPKLIKGEKVPVWVSMYVLSFNDEHTTIKLDFSGEFSDNEDLFFHKQNGMPPFQISGPTIPEKWKSLEEDGTFPFKAFQ
ncbi:MAG: hypothetical protein NE334_11370 [Lentisphaeraceae bacterium]|nr:hypothetical protein [Lentisphaeraceae bacterium]